MAVWVESSSTWVPVSRAQEFMACICSARVILLANRGSPLCPGMGEAIHALEVSREALPPAAVDDIRDQMAFLWYPKKGKGRKSTPTASGLSLVRRRLYTALNITLTRN